MIYLGKHLNSAVRSTESRHASGKVLVLARALLSVIIIVMIGIMLIYTMTQPEWLLWLNRGL